MANIGNSERKVFHRDNSRFKFFYDNGKPQLPADCSGQISTTPILKAIRDRKAVAEQ